MLGKFSSVATITSKLRKQEASTLHKAPAAQLADRHVQIRNYALTEFVQGRRTRRWAVAWSHQAYRLPDVSRPARRS